MLLISFCYALLGSYPFGYKIAFLHYQFHFHHLSLMVILTLCTMMHTVVSQHSISFTLLILESEEKP